MIDQDFVFKLIHEFVDYQVDAETFCVRFTDLWTQNRDAMYAKKRTWLEPYDEILMSAFQRGEITEDAFSEKFAELWGYTDSLSMQNLMDTIHSACSVFRSVPVQEWEIDENQLRLDVSRQLKLYNSKI